MATPLLPIRHLPYKGSAPLQFIQCFEVHPSIGHHLNSTQTPAKAQFTPDPVGTRHPAFRSNPHRSHHIGIALSSVSNIAVTEPLTIRP